MMLDSAPIDPRLLTLLPESKVGAVRGAEPLTGGLSGALVYGVTTSTGAYVLRVQSDAIDTTFFEQYLRILRRASDAGIAPPLVHVDEGARAVVSARIQGMPLPAVLANPGRREVVLLSVVDLLRRLHALDPSGIAARDPVPYARAVWEKGRERPGFPAWARELGPALDEFAAMLTRDTRRVLGHNDVNPGNFLWDGERAWLVDWDVAGLAHPHYDLATLAMFLGLEDDVAFALAARHDGEPLDETSRATFRCLRQLVALLCGLTFVSLVPDLTVREAPALSDAPSLVDVYQGLRAGRLDMRTPYAQLSMGLALLALGIRQG
jgi:thiamine kinase-like enzyme